MLKASFKKGLGFGLSAAVITTLAVIVGIHAGTDLRHAVIAAIIVIAFADSMADAFGVYISERSAGTAKLHENIIAAIVAFFTKMIFALSFLIPIFLFSLHPAIVICIIYGLIVLIIYSVYLAKSRHDSIIRVIALHVLLAVVVISLSHLIGTWVNHHLGAPVGSG